MSSKFIVEFEQEDDGRWIVEIPAIPGALAYGRTAMEAFDGALLLAYESIQEERIKKI